MHAPCGKIALLRQGEGTVMFLVTEARIRQMQSDIKKVIIQERGSKEWLVYLVAHDSGNEVRFGIITFRQKERVFGSPNTAVGFIKKNIPGQHEITISLLPVAATN